MDRVEPSDWTLDEHLVAGVAAISLVQSDHRHSNPQPICHHFDEVDPVDPMQVSVEATYQHLRERFSELGVVFQPDRLEAWETNQPNEQWLNLRVPAIFVAATASGLVYRGWSWEPVDGKPVKASNIQLINNRTA